jgi:zinc transport system permease protein
VFEPFFIRALAAGVGLALVAAPLGCVVVWRRMAYFGETIAQASLIGIAIGVAWQINLTIAVIVTALAVAGLLIGLGRQKLIPTDSLLGLLHHTALAAGLVATALLKGPAVDLVGYLFGDVLAVTAEDLIFVYVGGALVLAGLAYLWTPLLRLAIHPELAAAEGVNAERVRIAFTLLLAVTIALAMKIVGVLLAIAFLIIPAVAARPLSDTAERMAILAALVAAGSVVVGLMFSLNYDVQSGPAIVLMMSACAFGSMAWAGWRDGRATGEKSVSGN